MSPPAFDDAGPDPYDPEGKSGARPDPPERNFDLEIMLGNDASLRDLARQGGSLDRVPVARTAVVAFAVTAYVAAVTDVSRGLFLAVLFGGFTIIAVGQVANSQIEAARRMCRGILITALVLAAVMFMGTAVLAGP